MRGRGGEDGRQDGGENGGEFADDNVADGLGLEVEFRVRPEIGGRRGRDFGGRQGVGVVGDDALAGGLWKSRRSGRCKVGPVLHLPAFNMELVEGVANKPHLPLDETLDCRLVFSRKPLVVKDKVDGCGSGQVHKLTQGSHRSRIGLSRHRLV